MLEESCTAVKALKKCQKGGFPVTPFINTGHIVCTPVGEESVYFLGIIFTAPCHAIAKKIYLMLSAEA
jgi:hypothetical protein